MKDNHKQITTYLSKLVDTFYKGSKAGATKVKQGNTNQFKK